MPTEEKKLKLNRYHFNTKFLVQSAIIAAMYTVITLLLAPVSYGPIQVRVAEALTVLPFFTGAAVPGLFVGCLISNMMGGYGLLDIVLGSVATLVAALITYKIKRKWLAPLPSVVVNGLVIGVMLSFLTHTPMYLAILTVALGQLIACYGLGYPLLRVLEKHKDKFFSR